MNDKKFINRLTSSENDSIDKHNVQAIIVSHHIQKISMNDRIYLLDQLIYFRLNIYLYILFK